MTKRTTVMIKMLEDWKGIAKGAKIKARSEGSIYKVVEGEHTGTILGKKKVKVEKVLPNETA